MAVSLLLEDIVHSYSPSTAGAVDGEHGLGDILVLDVKAHHEAGIPVRATPGTG